MTPSTKILPGEFSPHRRGFTLLELLVGLAIVSVLAVFVFVSMRSITERTNGISCAHNMRQLSVALLAYRSDHGGWFPPGYPLAPNAIKAADAQPGQPPQPGPGETNFNPYLIPNYLAQLPLCPSMRLTPEGRAKAASQHRTEAQVLQGQGGGYGINGMLLEWKPEAMPWPGFSGDYAASRMPFLMEVGCSSVTWNFIHQTQTLYLGIPQYGILPRNHGAGEILNFMFLDGHMEAMGHNDKRDIPDTQKTWLYPGNPNGRFQLGGLHGRFIPQSKMSPDLFKSFYPQFYPPASE